MKCLVTGGVGFVGTNLIRRLLNDGNDVTSLDNYSTGFKENEQKGCTYISGDVRDLEFWGRRLEKDDLIPDVIFHMAALPRIGPSFKNPKEVCDINVGGTQYILEYARKNDTPVIYAGSSSFWGGTHKNPYTFSKWQGEELCKLYEQIYGLDVTICRFYNVYGNHMPMSGGYRTVLPIFLEQYKKGLPLTITGDGEQRRDFTHVDDIVDAMIRVVELMPSQWGSTFELGRGKNYSINEVTEMFGAMGNGDVKYIDEIPGETRDTLCHSSLARKKLKWKPEINLDDWIGEQI
jgi:UDP-glucose 4-epimerase